MSNPIFQFSTAKRQKSKASIIIEGLSGRGKSGLALVLATALSSAPDKVFALDTENCSLNLCDGLPSTSGGKFGGFQTFNFTPEIGFKPSNYIAAREAAIEAGAETLVQDSITHAWAYKGGILDMISELKNSNTRYQRDSYAAWGDDTIVKEKNMLNQMLRDSRVHVISTVRVKERLEYDRDDNGKSTLTSLGDQQIMQADIKYEPDLVLQMIEPGCVSSKGIKYPKAKVSKSRYAIFEVGETYEFTPQLCEQLKQYLEEGADPAALLEAQRQDYIVGIKAYLDSHKNAVPLWNQLKADAGYKDKKLGEIPLPELKDIFIKLTID